MSHAASRLGVRQSTLSIAVKRLEGTLGEELFFRSKVGVALTKAGQSFQRDARELFNYWNQIKSNVHETHSKIQGRFSIACHPSAGAIALPKVLAHVVQHHEEIEFRILTEYSGTVVDQVAGYHVDFGITALPHPHPELRTLKIISAEIGFWKSRSLEIKENLPLIYDPLTIGTGQLLRKLNRLGKSFQRNIEVGNLELALELTHAGVGVGVLPDVTTKRKGSKLVQLFPEATYQSPISLVYRASAQGSLGSLAVIDAFRMFYGN
jgi:LysR family transcriptional regulator, cell division regulator